MLSYAWVTQPVRRHAGADSGILQGGGGVLGAGLQEFLNTFEGGAFRCMHSSRSGSGSVKRQVRRNTSAPCGSYPQREVHLG